MTPRVAVLTVTYNQARYIGQCVESVLGQSFADWEMIVADDGSSDRTCVIAESYRDPRIKVLRFPHRGIHALRDRYAAALAASTAPLLGILDGDDYWLPHKLATQLPAMDDGGVVMTFGKVDIVDGDGALVEHGVLPGGGRGVGDGSALVVTMLRNRFFPYSATVVVRRKAIEQLGGFVQPPGVPLVDFPTWLNVLPQRKYAGIDETLAVYRVHNRSICRTRTRDVEEAGMRVAEDVLDTQWRRIGVSENEYRRLRRELSASHAYRRALSSSEDDWPRARALFREALLTGSPGRKIKTAVRYVLAALQRPKINR